MKNSLLAVMSIIIKNAITDNYNKYFKTEREYP